MACSQKEISVIKISKELFIILAAGGATWQGILQMPLELGHGGGVEVKCSPIDAEEPGSIPRVVRKFSAFT